MDDLTPPLRAHLEMLELLPDRSDRIQYLISLADRFRDVPPSVATRPFGEEHRVPQCESEAYVWASPREGRDDGLPLRGGEPAGRVGQGARR